MTPSVHIWKAAGTPPHPYLEESRHTCCATCGREMIIGIPLDAIETPTMANHADNFRFGSKNICRACAWLFAIGKGRPGNFLAYGDHLEYLVISLESVVTDKRPWCRVLPEIATLFPDTLTTGVMTTDVKPRLWPRCRMATVGNFGLYLHAPDYDVSEWRQFDLSACLAAIQAMLPPLTAGFTKSGIYHSLYHDYPRASRDIMQTGEWEGALMTHRGKPHFLPALIAAGITKEEKRDVRRPR